MTALDSAHDTPSPVARRALPIVRETSFDAVRRKEAPLVAEVARLDLEALRRFPLLSANAKTSISLDFPIGQTCEPTPLCARYCYASSPRAATTWRKSLRKRLRNLRYIELADPEEAAEKLAKEFRSLRRRWAPRAKLDYLRVNGTGDLFPALVPVLNLFAARNADVKLWIVTRRFELAPQILPLLNVYLQLSLDRTTPPEMERTAREIVETHQRAYLSFLRTMVTDDPKTAAIVFNEKRTHGLPYNGRTDCPVDAGRLALDNVRGVGGTACSKCRKCFSDMTLDRQREKPPVKGACAS